MKAKSANTIPGTKAHPGDPRVVFEDVTPERAKGFVANMTINRKAKSRQVDKHVRAMKAGQWRLTGDTIKFNRAGKMIDGQHRCLAVIASGITVRMAVAYDCDDDVFMVLDEGARRSGADVLTILGAESVQATSAALKIIKAYSLARARRVPLSTVIAAGRMANWEVPIWHDAHPHISEWVTMATRIHRKVPVSTSTSSIAAALYVGAQMHPDATYVFAQKVIDGDSLAVGDAPLLLINRSPVSGANTSGEAGQALTFDLVGRCLQLWWGGIKQKNLYVPTKFVDLGPITVPDGAEL